MPSKQQGKREKGNLLLAVIDGTQEWSPALSCPLQIQNTRTDLRDAPSKTSMKTRRASSLCLNAFPGEQRFVLPLPEPSIAQASCNALYCFIFTTRAPQRNNWGSTLCHIKERKGKWVERLDCALEILQFNWNSRNTPRFEEGLRLLDYSSNQFSHVHQERKFLFISTF